MKHLTNEGAKVWISDINAERVKEVAALYKTQVVEGDAIFDLDMDIYAPCALGATVNDQTLSKLKCAIICGAANNQLADEKVHGEAIMKKGLIYAPDFVVNAGGLINVYNELLGYNRERAMKQAETIYGNVAKVFQIAKAKNIPTYMAANQMAEERIAAIGKVKLSY